MFGLLGLRYLPFFALALMDSWKVPNEMTLIVSLAFILVCKLRKSEGKKILRLVVIGFFKKELLLNLNK